MQQWRPRRNSDRNNNVNLPRPAGRQPRPFADNNIWRTAENRHLNRIVWVIVKKVLFVTWGAYTEWKCQTEMSGVCGSCWLTKTLSVHGHRRRKASKSESRLSLMRRALAACAASRRLSDWRWRSTDDSSLWRAAFAVDRWRLPPKILVAKVPSATASWRACQNGNESYLYTSLGTLELQAALYVPWNENMS